MSELIDRQAALDTIMGQPPEPHYPSWYAAQIEKLPAVQPNHTADIGKKVDVDDCISRQAAIDALHMHLMYRMGTDSNKKRLDDWINGVPSVQPEIIRCKDCDWWTNQEDSVQGRCELMQMYPAGGWYCGNARRRKE